MAIALSQSTAGQEVIIGPFLDDTDGKTAETALTIAASDIKVWKPGATALVNKNSGGATHMANGLYYCVLDGTDTDTAGTMVITVHVSGALPVRLECDVLPVQVYNSLTVGSDRLQTHVDEMTAGIITAAVIATGAIDADAVAADAVTEIQSGLALAGALQTVDDLVDDLEARLTATRAGYLDNLSAGAVATASAVSTLSGYVDTEVAAILAAVDTEVGAIKAKTDALPASPAAVGSPMTLATDAVSADALKADAVTEIQSGLALDATVAKAAALSTVAGNVDAILVDTGTTLDGLLQDIPTVAEFNARTLPTADYFDPATDTVKLSATTHTGATIPTVTAITNDVGITQGGADKVWSSTTRTLTAFGFSVTVGTNSDKTGYSLSGAGIQAIWDTLTSALTTAGSIGKLLADRIDAAITSRMATFSYTAPLDAAGTRTALGMSAANLDTQLADIPTNSELNARTLASADYFNPATDDVTLAAGELAGLSTLTAAQVWSYVTRELTSGGGGGGSLTASEVWSYATRELTGKSGFELVAAYDAAKDAASASAMQTVDDLVDDLESRLTAARAGYLDKLNVSGTLAHSDAAGTYRADVSGLATAAAVSGLNNLSAAQVWAYVTRELTSAGSGGATAQEVWEYATRTLTGKTGFELTAAYDAAKTAASQTSVDDLPTNGELATALTGMSTLNAAGVRAAVGLANANLDTQLADLPTVAEFNARTLPGDDYFNAATDDVTLATGELAVVSTLTAAEVWGHATRELTGRTGFELIAAYDAAKTAAQAGDPMTLAANAVTAASLAADAVAEVQSGLATASSISALNDLSTVEATAAAASALATYAAAKTSDLSGVSTFNAATDAVTVGTIQVDAVSASAIAASAANEIADAILSRSYGNVEATAGDHTLAALIAGALESAMAGTTWTIYRTDGTTPMLTKTIATNAAAEPVTGVG